jgi:multidrug transporter EmrE-like cation transporter
MTSQTQLSTAGKFMSLGNILLFLGFFTFTSAGMVFIKLGGQPGHAVFYTVPGLGFKLSAISLLGFFFYGVSFLLYSTLLQRFELSYLNPATVGITAILMFICAAVIFGETITAAKLGSLILILAGVLILNLMK